VLMHLWCSSALEIRDLPPGSLQSAANDCSVDKVIEKDTFCFP
jgi:hypothetical protein